MRNKSGFTLVEMVVAICVLGILALFAVPNLRDHLSHMKVKAAARDVYSAFQQAKLEAVKENENVVVAFSPAAYSPEGNNREYQLFLDDGAGSGTAGNGVRDGGETTVLTMVMPKGVSLISAVFSDGTVTTDQVGFTGQGLPADSFSGTVEVRNSDRWYRINLSVAGNINIQKSDDGTNWS